MSGSDARAEKPVGTGARETRGEEEEAGSDGTRTAADGDGGGVVGVSLVAQESALRKLVQNLRLRDFHDEELLAALADLEDGVLARRKEASSWDRYRAEVTSGAGMDRRAQRRALRENVR